MYPAAYMLCFLLRALQAMLSVSIAVQCPSCMQTMDKLRGDLTDVTRRVEALEGRLDELQDFRCV